jgi:hypothetical protein
MKMGLAKHDQCLALQQPWRLSPRFVQKVAVRK